MTTPAPPPATGVDALTAAQKDAYQSLSAALNSYGLASLAPQLLKIIQQGYTDPNAIDFLLQQTPEFQQRFAGNAVRVKNGLSALTPGQYLATEDAYRQVLRAAGLPPGFYDSTADFATWIGTDVSATEVQARANAAGQLVASTDPYTKQALQDYYGIDEGHIASFFLDQKRALPLLQQMENAAQIGGAASRQGLSLSVDRATQFASQGVSGAQAEQAYQQIGAVLPEEQRLAQIYGSNYAQSDLENELLGGLASAQRKRQQLGQQEVAQFSGSPAVGSNLYNPGYGVAGNTSGQF